MVALFSWERPDLYPESGMTFIKVNIPSGYMVTRDTVHKLYAAGVPGLRRVRFCDQHLYLFFESVRQKTYNL